MTTLTIIETTRHFIGHSSGFNAGGTWVIGPVLVDVVTRDDGVHTPSYFVHIDGRHQFGGVAAHLGDDGLPKSVSFLHQLVECCVFTSADECAMAAEREVAGTTAALRKCSVHPRPSCSVCGLDIIDGLCVGPNAYPDHKATTDVDDDESDPQPSTDVELEETLIELIRSQSDDNFDELAECDVSSYRDAGVMTNDHGFVVRMRSGAEFQVTIVQSARASR